MNPKRWLQTFLPMLVVVALLAAQAKPVYAAGEPPPPGVEPKTKSEPAAPAASEKPRPPQAAPDQVASSAQAAYQADGVLKDARGNSLPLTAKVVDVIPLSPGVQVCPPGVFPFWLGGNGVGCVISFFSGPNAINDAIANTHVVTNWGIFVQADISHAEAVIINKSVSVMGESANFDTIANSVTFTSGNATLSNFTINGGSVKATGLPGLIRLQDLVIHNPGSYGIDIEGHKGTVELANIISIGNQYGGFVDTTAGTGGVVISNSIFEDSTGLYGLQVFSKGTVVLDNVVASHTLGGDGAIIRFGKSLVVRRSAFENNHNDDPGDAYGTGLYAKDLGSTGTILLQDVEIEENEENGAWLESNGNIAIENGIFSRNHQQGLIAASAKGAITLNEVAINNNETNGAILISGVGGVTISNASILDNKGTALLVNATGNISLNTVNATAGVPNGMGTVLNNSNVTTPRTITINASSFFANSGDGLFVASKGNISLTGINSGSAGGNGAVLDNCREDATTHICKGSGSVSVAPGYFPSNFSPSSQKGLVISSKSSVTLRDIIVSDSTLAGIEVDTCHFNILGVCTSGGNLTIDKAQIKFNGTGIMATVGGNVVLDRLDVFKNTGGSGVNINLASVTPKTITVTDSTFAQNLNSGLVINARGNVTLDHIIANENTSDTGIYVTSSGGSLTVSNKLGPNVFSGNYNAGLEAHVKGSITLIDVTASDSVAGRGLVLENQTGTGAVTLTNAALTHNFLGGLLVQSKGSILLQNTDIEETQSGFGAYLDNSAAASAAAVITVKNSTFFNNAGYGLEVLSKGNISLDNDVVNLNQGFGARLDNCLSGGGAACIGSGMVVVQGTRLNSQFSLNALTNLVVFSKGNIVLDHFMAAGSVTGDGVQVDNHLGTGKVSISNAEIDANQLNGLVVVSQGNITIISSSFDSGFGNGLVVNTKGTITVDSSSVTNNNHYGAVLTSLGGGKIEIKSTFAKNTFSHNELDNLQVWTTGSISLNGVVSTESQVGKGAWLTNNGGMGDVKISNSTFSDNYDDGMFVESAGNVTLNKVIATGNDGNPAANGVYILNAYAAAGTRTVTVTQSKFELNGQAGLVVKSRGQVTLNNVVASDNGFMGAELDNCDRHTVCTGAGSVNILSSLGPNQFSGNLGSGLYVESNGDISVSKARVTQNGQTALPANAASGGLFSTTSSHTILLACSTFAENGKYGIDATVGSGRLVLQADLIYDNHQSDGLPLTDPQIRKVGGIQQTQPGICGS